MVRLSALKLSGAKLKAAQHSVHLTGGILRHFRAFSTPKQNPALEVLSPPAHPQVTQTVRPLPCKFALLLGEKTGYFRNW